MGQESPAPARWGLPILLLLSGFCGISYEILYTKLLGNLLGNQFVINATVLLTFLLGIGFGTLYAHRLARFLWIIEASIGLYAALMAAFYGTIDHFLYRSIPVLGTNILAAAAVSFVLLLVPAFLIGCSIPLFAGYLSTLRTTHVFSVTYGLYNVGAAITALAMEFVLLRAVGLRAATVLLAGLNVVVAVGLLALIRATGLRPADPPERLRFPARVLAALAMASVASAVFQLMMIKVAEFVFGPYNETFSLVLATVLLGIAVGSVAAGRFRLTFAGALLVGLAGLAFILATLPAAAGLYASLYPAASGSYATLVLLKLGLVVTLMGLPAIGFGATIPALLNTHRDVARESGQLLFCSSVANAFGFLLMAFVLHRYLDYGPILLLLATITAAALLLHGGSRRKAVVAAVVLLALAGCGYLALWDETLLYVGHKSFHSAEDLREEREHRLFADRFKGPQDVFAIVWKDRKPYFFINGYISIPLSSTSEKLVGALSAMLSPRLDEALVLGMGSGGTAGTVGLLYEHTDVVEINKVVLQNLHRMSEYNFDVESMRDVNIIHDDGIHYVKTTPKKYSLILNTVTTPLYFSSSKLYTRDFLRLVSRRLTPDGIYITWVDARIGDRGIDIILQTLDDTFDTCWQTYMKSNYYIMACSDSEIQVRQAERVVANERLADYLLRDHFTPIHLLPYSIISTDARRLASKRELPINTLDYPILEFEMARLRRKSLRRFKKRLDVFLDLERIRETLSAVMPWSPAEFLIYADLRTKQTSTLSSVLSDHVREEFGEVGEEYERVALELAESTGSAKGLAHYGKRLAHRGRHAGAARAYARALELDPTLNDAHYELGRALFEMQDYDGALRHFVREWGRDRDDSVPLRAGRALIRLGRYDEALDWLDTAQEVGRREERVAYWRGVAYEGLQDMAAAMQHYQLAVDKDPGYETARRALTRLRDGREG